MRRLKAFALASVSALALAACAHVADYELCDTPNCGDDVIIEVE